MRLAWHGTPGTGQPPAPALNGVVPEERDAVFGSTAARWYGIAA